MADTGFGNGRISLRDHFADLMSANDRANAQRFDAIQAKLDELADDINDHGKRIRECEQSESANAERWAAHKEEHKREAAVLRVFAGVSSTVGGALATLYGVLTK